MSQITPIPPPVTDVQRPNVLKVGMLCFLLSEVAFFGTLIMTFTYFLNRSTQDHPSPREVFKLPLVVVGTICLLLSSYTIHLAEKALSRGTRSGFLRWWGLTILLGVLFLVGTGVEWVDLIFKWNLTISRNLFGSTYFTLVGFHAAHVTVGLIILGITFGLVATKHLPAAETAGVTVVSWYWHFVDGVWIVVFTLVYVIARGMS